MEAIYKVCNKCKKEKFIGEFRFGKIYKDGFKTICKICSSEKSFIHKEIIDLNNEEKEKIKLYKKKIANEKKQEYRKKRRENDPKYKFICDARKIVHDSFYRKGFKKNDKSQNLLGCSFEEFKLYLESKFKPWMNWNNRGLYTGKKNETWHIDHIIPLASANTIEDVIKLSHYTNFQPLDSYINQKTKRDKMPEEFPDSDL